MALYNAEQEVERKFPPLEPINREDFVIDDNAFYAIAVLKDFMKNKKIPIEDENEVIGVELISLRNVEIHDTESGVTAKYELNDEIDGEQFTETVEISVNFGYTKNDNVAVQIRQESGNYFYFKKIAFEIKNLYRYCQIEQKGV